MYVLKTPFLPLWRSPVDLQLLENLSYSARHFPFLTFFVNQVSLFFPFLVLTGLTIQIEGESSQTGAARATSCVLPTEFPVDEPFPDSFDSFLPGRPQDDDGSATSTITFAPCHHLLSIPLPLVLFSESLIDPIGARACSRLLVKMFLGLFECQFYVLCFRRGPDSGYMYIKLGVSKMCQSP